MFIDNSDNILLNVETVPAGGKEYLISSDEGKTWGSLTMNYPVLLKALLPVSSGFLFGGTLEKGVVRVRYGGNLLP